MNELPWVTRLDVIAFIIAVVMIAAGLLGHYGTKAFLWLMDRREAK